MIHSRMNIVAFGKPLEMLPELEIELNPEAFEDTNDIKMMKTIILFISLKILISPESFLKIAAFSF